jgi:hypothetical protein
MQRPTSLRASVACAVLVAVTACGAPQDTAADPVAGPDLFAALPAPSSVSAEPAPTSTTPKPVPTVPSATPEPSAKPKPRTSDGSTTGSGSGAARPGAEPAGAPEGGAPALPWRPVASDDFGGGSLGGEWYAYEGRGGFGNGRRTPDSISQEDGLLTITRRGEDSGGLGHTVGQLYGRWEVRARSDPGKGLSSVALLWPDSENWPEDGEIDFMEVPDADKSRAHSFVHWGEGGADRATGNSVTGDFTQWHVFAVEWLPDRVTTYVDGRKVLEVTDPAIIPDTPMHLTLQLDQGPVANWLPAPDAGDARMQVDWVKVYQL